MNRESTVLLGGIILSTAGLFYFANALDESLGKIKPEQPSTDTIEMLSSDIINPNIPPLTLQKQGYFTKGNGTQYVDGCRNQFLSSEFANQASNNRLAEAITDCAYKGAYQKYSQESSDTADAILIGTAIGLGVGGRK